MSDKKEAAGTNGHAKSEGGAPIKVLRERHGGMSAEMKEYYKELNSIRKQLFDALKAGPMTVPELASKCALKSETTMWHVMAMRRYGEVVEDKTQGDYYSYRLKEAH